MAVSRNTENRQKATFWERVFGQLSRYDLVLAAIPILFALSYLGHLVLSVPYMAALAASAILSVVLLVDALFFNPPVPIRH